MQAFIDLFWFIGWVTFALVPLVFLMKRPERKGLPPAKGLKKIVTSKATLACKRLCTHKAGLYVLRRSSGQATLPPLANQQRSGYAGIAPTHATNFAGGFCP